MGLIYVTKKIQQLLERNNRYIRDNATTENDPFRPDKLPKQRHATVELSKINSTKPCELKDDQIIVENKHSFTVNDNDSNFSDFAESSSSQPIIKQSTSNNKSRLHNLLVPIKENMNMSYSVELCQTKRIQNNKRKAALGGCPDSIDKNANTLQPQRRKIENFALEKLFEEQNISWNCKEFVRECQFRNIHLDNDNIANMTKLISWFGHKKNKVKYLNNNLDIGNTNL
ncbi:42188_t:CDS:2 [Gigaspora margarita]|uniref:42188_t:CDS:1 n=1 Tax=Gigaspora margarita TaxID=4874 RepID=A0ABN7UD79_GIGMA|nr:42188_t:CDS:2 [Gigaspora margarita]